MKKLHANIGFHLTHSNKRDDDFITIDIVDRLSRCPIARIEMTFDDYSKGVLTSCHDVPCIVELHDESPVGKKIEHKDAMVWIPNADYGEKQKKAIRKALSEFEIDGWQGNDDDARNSHKCRTAPPPEGVTEDGSWYRIGFTRWVEATPEDVKKAAKSRY